MDPNADTYRMNIGEEWMRGEDEKGRGMIGKDCLERERRIVKEGRRWERRGTDGNRRGEGE